eukprot:GHVL01032726.1.p1 GENE.GHVL01032726.1~~GHVL01032726.1.p1  ORF type:complete len:262 (+),score=45.58 GHVL01032726.1:30-815(+)
MLSACWRQIREIRPVVLCVTDRVSAQRVADIVLAAGASHSMIESSDEITENAGQYRSIYLKTGYHQSQIENRDAIISTRDDGILVIEPHGMGQSLYRSEQILYLVENARPDLIKGTAQEIVNLEAESRVGNESIKDSSEAANRLAVTYSCTVAVTGPTDYVVEKGGDGRTATIAYDSLSLQRIPGISSATGALCAAGMSVTSDPFIGAVFGMAALKFVALEGSKVCKEPGSLSILIIDELFKYSMKPQSLNDNFVNIIEKN